MSGLYYPHNIIPSVHMIPVRVCRDETSFGQENMRAEIANSQVNSSDLNSLVKGIEYEDNLHKLWDCFDNFSIPKLRQMVIPFSWKPFLAVGSSQGFTSKIVFRRPKQSSLTLFRERRVI